MSYLNETGLSYYAPKLKEWISSQPVKTLPSSLYPWTLTDKAGAVTCWPVGGTPLKPSVDYIFTETPPANGQPKAPDNPSTITGVSSVNIGRVGKNLLLKVASTQTAATVTMTPQSDGSYIFNGTASSNESFAVTDSGVTYAIPVYSSVCLDVNKQYILTAKILSGTFSGNANISLGYLDGAGQNKSASFTDGIASDTFDSSYFPHGRFLTRLRVYSGASFSNAKIVFQLEEGSTATDFEAPMLPADANHVLSLGNTYYGGTLDVASGVMTVTWWGLVLDGTEDWISIGGGTYYGYKIIVPRLAPSGSALAPVYNTERCTHFDIQNSVSLSSQHAIVYGNSFAVFTTQNTLASFKQWVADQKTAGHPLSVVYPLAEPITVQLTPTEILSLAQSDKYTPRLNTVYTDAQAVQVGYVKSPIRDEYELQQAIVAQGGNV